VKDTTTAVITDNPYETQITIFDSDFAYYKTLFNQLDGERLIHAGDYSFLEADEYLELKNTKELDKILYDLPHESKPKVNDIFKLTTNKDLVQQAIENARKKTDTWADFQVLYDLHPAIKYYMTKLEASVPKNEALAAKLSIKLPAQSAWYVLQGQVSNNRGQPVISDFFVVGIKENSVSDCLTVPDFITQFQLDGELFREEISAQELMNLQAQLSLAIDYAQQKHMRTIQGQLSATMFDKLVLFDYKLIKWKSASL
jgi:hypothetical protein